jgi:glycosyltransferase involved in cell wall biosynthesis
MSSIGVAIPCYKFHIPSLKRCLDSIEAQTVKPQEVIVACSSCKSSDIPFSSYNYSFTLRVLPRPERRNAAENRNYAASFLTTDIITFFDADDEMHPQRLEAITKAFQQHPSLDIVLHSFLEGEENNKPYEIHTSFDFKPQSLQKSPTGCAVYKPNWGARIHHSQVSVSRFIYGRVQFKEDPGNERREDAIFCGDILGMDNCQNVYIATPLSKYYIEGVTHPVA